MKLLAFLGNPGKKYENTRHNAGFVLGDFFVKEYNLKDFSYKSKFKGEVTEGNIHGTSVCALKPMTYMNLSGTSVSSFANFYKIQPEDILAVFDDIDLEPGKFKLKKGGGNAGHKGVKDIESKIGANGFRRLRIGVGRPFTKEEVVNYVLSKFSKAEMEKLEENKTQFFSMLEEFLGF